MKKTQSMPLISVIMPVKDTGKFVGKAVESVQNQTYQNWEMIIVDDGSRDGTGKILSKISKSDKRIRIIVHNKSLGIGKSLNDAVGVARGKYIARMDGDDISLPNRLKFQLDFLQRNPGVVAVGGQAEMIDGEGRVFAMKNFPTEPKILREMIMWVVPIQHPMMMARADSYRKCRYDEHLSTAEDVEMFMQLLQYGEFGNLSETIYQYRKADTSNGYHNVKKTFYLTLLGRIRGITKYGYLPSLRGMLASIAQLVVVSILPSKLIVRLYESRRFVWIIREYLGRFAWLNNK